MTQHEFDAFLCAVCHVDSVDPSAPLADQGVDSLATLSLLVAIEDEFDVEIDPDALARGELSTSAALRAHVADALATEVPA